MGENNNANAILFATKCQSCDMDSYRDMNLDYKVAASGIRKFSMLKMFS